MTAKEALEAVNKILEPDRLSYIEELVLLQSWGGRRYREIAQEAGYDYSYIKEVGAQVWNSLSTALNQRVTKKNVKLVLATLRPTGSFSTPVRISLLAPPADSPRFPNGSVPAHSNLYVDRPPVEAMAAAEVNKPGSLIRIKAPQQMGKTSLIYRVLAHAQQSGCHTIYINLQQADRALFSDLNRFLRWLCSNISQQLHLELRLDEYWNDDIGSKVSCTNYLQSHILARLNAPLVLALDEVHHVFAHSALVQDFLPLLRTWHEEAATLPIWQNLRLVVAYSTDSYVPLRVSQSPFNTGLPVTLPGFNLEQAHVLAKAYGLDATEIGAAELQQVLDLVGGHPYLVQLALYWLRQPGNTCADILQTAPTQAGIYTNHLRHHWDVLQQEPELWTALRQVLSAPDRPVQLPAIAAYRLESMGLVAIAGHGVKIRCSLYHQYFAAQADNVEAGRVQH
jgi:hypothetical protein